MNIDREIKKINKRIEKINKIWKEEKELFEEWSIICEYFNKHDINIFEELDDPFEELIKELDGKYDKESLIEICKKMKEHMEKYGDDLIPEYCELFNRKRIFKYLKGEIEYD